MAKKSARLKILSLVFVALFLGGASEPCSGSCPVGAVVGPDQTCFYEINADGHWHSINDGELKVKIPQNNRSLFKKLAFWFVQDPAERAFHRRIGHWKLLIRHEPSSLHLKKLLISWKLRDVTPLASKETIRLALFHHQTQRQFKILPGSYDAKTHRVFAILNPRVIPNHGIYLLPIKYDLSIARRPTLTAFSPKTLASRLP